MADEFEDFSDRVESISGLSSSEIESLEQERVMFGESEAQMAQRMFRQNLLPAVRSITQIALHSSNEKLRFGASQYIVERNLGRIQDQPPAPVDDPIERLFNEVYKEVGK